MAGVRRSGGEKPEDCAGDGWAEKQQEQKHGQPRTADVPRAIEIATAAKATKK
jgi:hypothetical protein